MTTFGVVLAGGDGKRFWPLSRQAMPKQFLNLTGNDVLINETINRISNIVPFDNIFIVANKSHNDILNKVIRPEIKKENILLEPMAKNTAACICYAAFKIMKDFGDGIMCVFPSDHYIKDEQEFARIFSSAIEVAKSTNKLVTIGIKPSFASTGYGYIKINSEEDSDDFGKAYDIEEFKEKPDLDRAKEYITAVIICGTAECLYKAFA